MSDALDIQRLERFAARTAASPPAVLVGESTPPRSVIRSSPSSTPSSLARRVLDVGGGGGLGKNGD